MSDSRKEFETLVGPSESLRVMESLKRGASRRDVLKMLMAGGMQAALAGSLAGTAVSAYAQTPRRGGRIRVAAATAAATDTLDPAKQSNQNDYVRCNMVYNGLFVLDGSLTPRPALAGIVPHRRCQDLGFHAAQGRDLPRRQGPGPGRRGVLRHAS